MWTVQERVLCGNELQRSGSRSEPDPDPNWPFGPVANTRAGAAMCQQSLEHLAEEILTDCGFN